MLREGEIGCWVLGQHEVGWQPGTMFYDSRYYTVRKAQPVEEVQRRAEADGLHHEIKPDAMSAPHESRRGEETADLVFVYHYLERPCPEYPFGRWLQLANAKPCAKEREYP